MNLIRITNIFFEWDFIGIEIKTSSCKIFEAFSIECTIWYIYNLSFSTHDFCIVEIDFFYDSFDPFDFDGVTDLKGFTQNNRQTSEKIGDDIFACEGKYSSSDSCSCQELAGIYLEVF